MIGEGSYGADLLLAGRLRPPGHDRRTDPQAIWIDEHGRAMFKTALRRRGVSELTGRQASRDGGSARFLQLPTMISNFLPSSRAFGCALCSLLIAGTATALPPLIRFPSSSAEQVAFVARGDLWIAPKDGGKASRLTEGGSLRQVVPRWQVGRLLQQTGGRRDVSWWLPAEPLDV